MAEHHGGDVMPRVGVLALIALAAFVLLVVIVGD
jgi:hypothetical protein